jgi:hypothetical protein
MLLYIGGAINSEPSDQTNLKQRCRLDLNGGGRTDVEAEHDRWDQEVGLHLSFSRGLSQRVLKLFSSRINMINSGN